METATARTQRPDKRSEVLIGALAVFARDGYTRASIDEIAATASVSTRTIYNHFVDKATLFHEVIIASAASVASAQLDAMDRHLAAIPDDAEALEAALTEFLHAWLAPVPEHRAHFALVRQVNAELDHIPPTTVAAWQEAGPLRVLSALAGHLRRFADAGLITVEDPDRAALHLASLTAPTNSSLPALRSARTSVAETMAAGIHVFLHGVLARRPA